MFSLKHPHTMYIISGLIIIAGLAMWFIHTRKGIYARLEAALDAQASRMNQLETILQQQYRQQNQQYQQLYQMIQPFPIPMMQPESFVPTSNVQRRKTPPPVPVKPEKLSSPSPPPGTPVENNPSEQPKDDLAELDALLKEELAELTASSESSIEQEVEEISTDNLKKTT
jgi:hypothetical protein